MAAGRGYRSKIEVLRDFLRAAQQPVPKTRLIGTANLNPASFRRYLKLCTERSLIVNVSGGYVTTPRATPVLIAIDSLILKRDELEGAFRVLTRDALDGVVPSENSARPFRHILREAWNEIVLAPAPRAGGVPDPSAPSTPEVVPPSPARRPRPRGPELRRPARSPRAAQRRALPRRSRRPTRARRVGPTLRSRRA